MLKDATKIVDLVFQVIKHDILSVLRPTFLVLESITILLPEAISMFETTLKRFEIIYRKFVEVGPDILKDCCIFPTFSHSILPLTAFDDGGVVLVAQIEHNHSWKMVLSLSVASTWEMELWSTPLLQFTVQ